MANPHKGEMSLDVGNVVYTVVYDFDIMVQMERHFKMGIPKLAGTMASTETLAMDMVRTILWYGLKRKHPTITEEQAGELIYAAGGVGVVTRLFGEAIQLAFPEAPESPQQPIQPALTGSANG
jgi:hypothetical protein